MERQKILFLSSKNPYSKKDWSGIPFHMFQALSLEYDVEYVPLPTFATVRRFGYYAGRIAALVFRKQYYFDYGVIIAKLYGIYGTASIRDKKNVKFVFSPAGLTETAYLKTSIPIVSCGDCSTLQLVDYYPKMKKPGRLAVSAIGFVEKHSLKKIDVAIFSSEWATSFITKTFNVKRCFTVPFGANLQAVEPTQTSKSLATNKCNLLFVGTDWDRKGGNAVLEIHQRLVDEGISSVLTIIGCAIPPGVVVPKAVREIQFLNRDNDKDEALYNKILSESNFLLLPSEADCSPIVICEAFAYGVPVLATRTGGIPTMIAQNVNGFLFGKGDINGYVEIIRSLLKDADRYEIMSGNCRKEYHTRYNWNSWVTSLRNIISSSIL
jgi:glycosyltransferase involved in cell wall biosynthesis